MELKIEWQCRAPPKNRESCALDNSNAWSSHELQHEWDPLGEGKMAALLKCRPPIKLINGTSWFINSINIIEYLLCTSLHSSYLEYPLSKIKIPVAYILQSNRMIKIIEMIESLKLNYTRRCLRKNIKQDERDWDPREHILR